MSHMPQKLLLIVLAGGLTACGLPATRQDIETTRVPASNSDVARPEPVTLPPPSASIPPRLTPMPRARARAVFAAPGGWGYDPTSVYDQQGVDVPRGFAAEAPNEAIDPFSGNLVLYHNDLRLPGVAGVDLNLQRVYNSKIHRNYAARATGDPNRVALGMLFVPPSPLGLGWSLHLGRLIGAVQSGPNNLLSQPRYYERPDGSQHPFFTYTGPGCGDGQTDVCLITKQQDNPYPTADGTWRLATTYGRIITFGHAASDGSTVVRYATEIRDIHGNRIQIFYHDDTIPGIPLSTRLFPPLHRSHRRQRQPDRHLRLQRGQSGHRAPEQHHRRRTHLPLFLQPPGSLAGPASLPHPRRAARGRALALRLCGPLQRRLRRQQ